MPTFRTDIIDLYILRRAEGAGWEVLQLRRTDPPLAGTWQPVMGHIQAGERATAAMAREAREELGLDIATSPSVLGLWQLEQTFPFYIADLDAIIASPRFLAQVDRAWSPVLNREHSAYRWVNLAAADSHFTWPGQLHALAEIHRILLPGSLHGQHLRLDRALLGK
ncbi:MAG: NUDIX domain-containing protein [Phycisphaerales bacterium]|jgi:8-oxo-dGTP pyrophosphatase MutT (NUDIX family)|nr:NUDIX domain-containing protein [Phycisphaerales bacterium]